MERLRTLLKIYWYVIVIVVLADTISQYFMYSEIPGNVVQSALKMTSHVASAFLHGGAYFLGFGILAEAMYLIAEAAHEIAMVKRTDAKDKDTPDS